MASPGGCDTCPTVTRKTTSSGFQYQGAPKLIAKELQPRLWAYIAAICKNQQLLTFAVGGMPDHIHILFRLPPTITLVRAVTLIKSNSSKWVREKGISLHGKKAMERSALAHPTLMQSSSTLTIRKHTTASAPSNRNSSRFSKNTTFRLIRIIFLISVAAYGAPFSFLSLPTA